MQIYINGQFFPKEEAKISVFDHGFLYGDGIFEGLRLYQGRLFRLEEHLQRLEYSAKGILLELPWSREVIAEAICETCRQNGLRDGYVRLVVTRGAGSLGLSPKTCTDPQLIIIADSIQLYPKAFYAQGLKVITSPTRRMNPAAFPSMVKSLNYLNNIMAKVDALNQGFEEAIMLNDQGCVAEATGDNIFILHQGILSTPPSASGALAGITRQAVIELARDLDMPVQERDLTRYDLWICDEMFMTGTAAEVIPVVEVDFRRIADGKPGKTTGRILEAFRRLVTLEGRRIDE